MLRRVSLKANDLRTKQLIITKKRGFDGMRMFLLRTAKSLI